MSEILRAKTTELLNISELTKSQKLNSELNRRESLEQQSNVTSYPRRIVLELTNNCNYNCIMCGGRDKKEFKIVEMDILPVINFIQPLLEYVEEITLFGYGEPTIYKNFNDMLYYLNNNYPNIKKYFVTNGSTLGSIQENLFKHHVDIMAISYDGAKTETNNRIRRNSNSIKIISDLKEIVKYKTENNLNYPYMNFVFVAMNSNLNELPQMVELTKEVGLDELKVVFFTSFTKELLNESLYNQQDRVGEIFYQAEMKAKELGIKLKLPYIQDADPSLKDLHKPCFVGWRDLFISCNNNIRPCMSTNIDFGNIKDYNNFDELWNSKNFNDFRNNVNCNDSMPEECKRCYQSSHSNTNLEHAWVQVDEKYLFDWR